MTYTDAIVDVPEKTRKQGDYYFLASSSESHNRGDRWVSVEKRKCIGKVIEGQPGKMHPNDNYYSMFPSSKELPPRMYSDTLSVGAALVIDRIMEDLGIRRMLKTIYGDDAAFIQDIIYYFIVGRTGVMQHISSFLCTRITMMDHVVADSEASALLTHRMSEGSLFTFQRKWVEGMDVKNAVCVSYDSTNYNCEMTDSDYAEYGHPKVDEGTRQTNVAYVVDMDRRLPLFFEQYYGSINDVAEFTKMAERAKLYGFRDITAIIDRGYFSKKNIDACDDSDYGFIIMAKSNNTLVKQCTEKHMEDVRDSQKFYIREAGIEGATYTGALFANDPDRFIHVYYDSCRAEDDRRALKRDIASMQEEIEQKMADSGKSRKAVAASVRRRYAKWFDVSYTRKGQVRGFSLKEDAISEEKRHFGFFCIITSRRMSAADALKKYRSRNSVEVIFKQLKSFMGMARVRVHSDEAAIAKWGIAFIASIVRSEFENRTEGIRKPADSSKTNDSVITFMDELEKIRATTGYDGKTYHRKYALTALQKKILSCFGLTEKDVDKFISMHAPNPSQL